MNIETAPTYMDSVQLHGIVNFARLEMKIKEQEFSYCKLSDLAFIAKV